jgi:hypothetical protein
MIGEHGVETTLATYQPASNPALSSALVGLARDIHDAAWANVVQAMGADTGYSEIEKEAMLVIEELRQVNGLDLAAVLMRGAFLRQIIDHNLATHHPEGYRNEGEMARKQGISWTELNHVKDLCEIVFPYVTGVLHMELTQAWEDIGKSNFVELIPVIKQLITGEAGGVATVEHATETILNNVAATALAAGQTLDDAALRRAAIEQLLEDATVLNSRQLRERVRPTRTANIPASIINVDGHKLIVMDIVDDGQNAMFQRLIGGHLDQDVTDLPADPHQRQVEAARVPVLRTLLGLLEG